MLKRFTIKRLTNRQRIHILFLLLTPLAQAEEEHRHHDAHEHGHAALNVALENQTVQVLLESPAVNIVGFEHASENAEERQILQEAIQRLKQGDSLFVFSPTAHCVQKEVTVETGLSQADDPSAPHETTESHADFDVSYTFDCSQPEALTEIQVKLFEHFPLTMKLDGQLVTGSRQLAVELSPAHATIRF